MDQNKTVNRKKNKTKVDRRNKNLDESSVLMVDESSVLLGRREFMDPIVSGGSIRYFQVNLVLKAHTNQIFQNLLSSKHILRR